MLTIHIFVKGYKLPWEDPDLTYPPNMAPALEVAVEASNGASDYGNKFGEPVLAGFARSFGLKLPSGERREWVKPIMFSAGIGSIDAANISKLDPQKGTCTMYTLQVFCDVCCTGFFAMYAAYVFLQCVLHKFD